MHGINDLMKITATLEANQFFFPYETEDIELISSTEADSEGINYQFSQFRLPNDDFIVAELGNDENDNPVVWASKNFGEYIPLPVISPLSEIVTLRNSYEEKAVGASLKYYKNKVQAIDECINIVTTAFRREAAANA